MVLERCYKAKVGHERESESVSSTNQTGADSSSSDWTFAYCVGFHEIFVL